MTPEERQILIQTHRMVEENNTLLRRMRRTALFGTVFRVFYWAIIIALSFGAYFFIQPYIDQLTGVYGGIKGSMDRVNQVKDAFNGLGQ